MKPSIQSLFQSNPHRRRDHRVSEGGWVFDHSHVPLETPALRILMDRFLQRRPEQHIEALFEGQPVNRSEGQAARHMELRSSSNDEVKQMADRFLEVAQSLHSGRAGLSDLIHIGIGGSDLGPRLVADALDSADGKVTVHWLSTVDGRRLQQLLATLDPAQTGVVIASKSFSTEETLVLAERVRHWLGERFSGQAWAATANPERAQAFGIVDSHILSFPQWTGGRFSLWSSVGVSAAACIGVDAFRLLMEGAHQADQHYRFAQGHYEGSLAVWFALVVDHLRRGLDFKTLGIVAYEPRLALLGDYCQQLFMESLGKRLDVDDQPIDEPTVPLIFGGRGTDLQHSIFQALHQGIDTHPLLLVGALSDPAGDAELSRVQLAHLLAQRQAFAQGRADGQAFQKMPGNRPVSVLLTDAVTPERLGFLLASLEHAVFSLSVLWGINAFDQWGVEEGKRLAGPIKARLASENPDLETLLDWG